MRLLLSSFILLPIFIFYLPNVDAEQTPQELLRRGCVTGDTNLIIEAIKRGADVNEEVAALTPLYLATSKNNLNAVILLVKNRAELNHLNGPAGRSALHQACFNGNFDLVKFLVQSGAEINIMNRQNRTPLDYVLAAKKTGSVDGAKSNALINYLTEKGAITGAANLRLSKAEEKEENGHSEISLLFVDHLGETFFLSVLWTWGLGLLPALLIRFAFLKRTLSTWPAFFIVGLLWALHFIFAVALKTLPSTHSGLFFAAFVSFYILRKT